MAVQQTGGGEVEGAGTQRGHRRAVLVCRSQRQPDPRVGRRLPQDGTGHDHHIALGHRCQTRICADLHPAAQVDDWGARQDPHPGTGRLRIESGREHLLGDRHVEQPRSGAEQQSHDHGRILVIHDHSVTGAGSGPELDCEP